MTPKEFLLKKYPTNIFFDCPVPKEYWKDMQGFSDANNKQLAEQNKELLEALKIAYEQIKISEKQIPIQNGFNLATEQGKKGWEIFSNKMVKIEKAIANAEK